MKLVLSVDWHDDPEWASGRIHDQSRTANGFLWLAGSGLAFASSWWILDGTNLLEQLVHAEWQALASAALIAGGVACVAMAAIDYARALLFGRPVLVCATVPFTLGDSLRASVEMRPGAPLGAAVAATVECCYTERDSEGSSTTVLWADERYLPAAAIARGGSVLRIPISFDLPDDVPAGPYRAGDIQWVVRLRAGRGLLALRAAFPVPVADPPQPQTATRPRRPSIKERIFNVEAARPGVIAVKPTRTSFREAALSLYGGAFFGVFTGFVGLPIPVGVVVGVLAAAGFYRLAVGRHVSSIAVEDGRIGIVSRGKVAQSIGARTVRAIDVASAPDLDPLRWNIRLHTIGGKTIVAAKVDSKRHAENIAAHLEELLTGTDRRQLNDLFGLPRPDLFDAK